MYLISQASLSKILVKKCILYSEWKVSSCTFEWIPNPLLLLMCLMINSLEKMDLSSKQKVMISGPSIIWEVCETSTAACRKTLVVNLHDQETNIFYLWKHSWCAIIFWFYSLFKDGIQYRPIARQCPCA